MNTEIRFADSALPLVDKAISARRAAEVLGFISDRRVRSLVADGWVKQPITILTVARGYVEFLRDERRRAQRTAAEGEIQRERARKLKLENDERERILIPLDDTLAATDFIWGIVQADLAGIGRRVTNDPQLCRKIEDAVDYVLTRIADRIAQAADDLRAGQPVGE